MRPTPIILIGSAVLLSACIPKTTVPAAVVIKPIVSEVTPAETFSTDTTPSYTFHSSAAGTIIYGGGCSSAATTATIGNNTITFEPLAVGKYDSCTVVVKDEANVSSLPLTVSPFDVTVLYTVNVSIPDGLVSTETIAARSVARSAGAAASFVVTEVDPETGHVIEEIPISNASQNGDGTWGVNVTTNPNAAKVLIVHANPNAPTVCINCQLPSNTVFAPITDTTIDVNPLTTVAFDETIGAETPPTLQELDDVMNAVTVLNDTLPTPDGEQTLEDYLHDVEDDYEDDIHHELYTRCSRAIKPLNDTGITLCANSSLFYPTPNLVCSLYGVTKTTAGTDSNGQPVPAGQDAHYGRDADPLTNSDTDGYKGFSYTKLNAAGAALAIQSGVYSETGNEVDGTKWSCVKDNISGLIWEIKQDNAGIRDKDWTFTWYNPTGKNDGGDWGIGDNGWFVTTNYQDSPTTMYQGTENCLPNGNFGYCDTKRHTENVNTSNLCGAHDWRLPTDYELMTILSWDKVNPMIDANYFPNTMSGYYWTSSPEMQDPHQASAIHFGNGAIGPRFKHEAAHVRLVRN